MADLDASFIIPAQVRNILAPQIAREHRILPLRVKGNVLIVVSDLELDAGRLENLTFVLGRPVEAGSLEEHRAVAERFSFLLDRMYPDIPVPERCSASDDLRVAQRLLDLGLISREAANAIQTDGVLALCDFYPAADVLRLLSVES